MQKKKKKKKNDFSQLESAIKLWTEAVSSLLVWLISSQQCVLG